MQLVLKCGRTCPMAEAFLEKDQVKIFGRRAGEHLCSIGDQVLVLLPVVNFPFQAHFSGLYLVMGWVSDHCFYC